MQKYGENGILQGYASIACIFICAYLCTKYSSKITYPRPVDGFHHINVGKGAAWH